MPCLTRSVKSFAGNPGRHKQGAVKFYRAISRLCLAFQENSYKMLLREKSDAQLFST
jgi:hypothetical protein